MGGLIAELRRRNVLRVGTAYLVVGWLILQLIDVVFPMFGLDESLGRLILILLLFGLPIVLILTWVFELTPEGIKREKDIDRSQSPAGQKDRLLDRAIIAILIFTIGLLLIDKFVLQQQSAPQQLVVEVASLNSVAVLPFVNLSGKKEDEYFSDGLTETLLHMLAQLPGLKVAARTSVFSFKGKGADVREIARSLGVATILEGSVQRSGEKVRITAQLIEAETGFHLWSQSFDRNLDDIFLVQDEIAINVANALQLTLLTNTMEKAGHVASLGTSDAQAYEKYLLGLEQKNIASYGALSLAEGIFKEALALDPDFREAKVELAITYGLQAETGLLGRNEAEAIIRPLLDQVLQGSPDDGRSLGLLAAFDWQEAARAYGPNSNQASAAMTSLRHAVDLAPNFPLLYFALSNIAMASGRNDESLEWLDKGLAIDPLSARLHLLRGRMLLGQLEKPKEAELAFAKGREFSPEWTALHIASGDAAFAQNHFAEGIAWYQRAMSFDPQDHEIPANISAVYYALGLQDEGDEMLRRAQALAPREPLTRGLELYNHMLADHYERVAILAEGMLRDNVENRGDTFEIAVMGYVGSMIELGKTATVADFFESLTPGISTVEYVPQGFKEGTMRLVLTLTLAQTGAAETANTILDELVASNDENGPGWREDNYVMATIAVVRGDRESAIEFALKSLDQPLGKQMGWSLIYQHVTWMKPLLNDARLVKRIAELEAETLAAGDEVRAMLMEKRAGTG